MTSSIQYRQLTDIEEIRGIQQLEKLVWEMEPIPIHQTLTAVKNGGIIIGAYDGKEIVGFTYGFPCFNEGTIYLCSHMMGIHPKYRGLGIGEELKKLQKQVASSKGYSLISWTFDPLENVNAYLNLHKLKGIAAEYIENNYGIMKDSLNYGLPTDRFKIEWWIDSEHVCNPSIDVDYVFAENKRLLRTDINKNGHPYILSSEFANVLERKEEYYLVPIPMNFQQLKVDEMGLAIDWRLKTREAFVSLMSSGYVGVDVIRGHSSEVIYYYVFAKRTNLKLSSNGD